MRRPGRWIAALCVTVYSAAAGEPAVPRFLSRREANVERAGLKNRLEKGEREQHAHSDKCQADDESSKCARLIAHRPLQLAPSYLRG